MGILSFVRAQWDRVGAVAAGALGLLSLFLGWWHTSGTEYVAKQLPYIVSGGLTGIFFLGAAVALWISADLRDEWRSLQNLGAELHTVNDRLARWQQTSDPQHESHVDRPSA